MVEKIISVVSVLVAIIYLFKVNNRNTRKGVKYVES